MPTKGIKNMSNQAENKSMSELINDALAKRFIESTEKQQTMEKAKSFLSSIIDEKAPSLAGSQKDQLGNELLNMFNALTNYNTKQVIASIQPSLFEKVMVDSINFIDLPFIDEMNIEQSRKDLMENIIHTDLQVQSSTIEILCTMFSATLVLAWNRLRTTIDTDKEPITLYNLIAVATEIFTKEAFDTEEH